VDIGPALDRVDNDSGLAMCLVTLVVVIAIPPLAPGHDPCDLASSEGDTAELSSPICGRIYTERVVMHPCSITRQNETF